MTPELKEKVRGLFLGCRSFISADYIAGVLVLAAVICQFLTTPLGDYWWSDAPRHALNGVFVRDFLVDLPLKNPEQYAINYYLQYPALTILFYPPLFPLVEALFYSLFGVSSFSAQLTVTLFYVAAALGVYMVARRWLSVWQAFSVSILFVALPELALWGRQVMLDVPAYAFLIWSVYLYLRFLDEEKPTLLYGAVIVYCLGLYTKLSIIFLLPIFLLTLLWFKGTKLFNKRYVWGSAILFIVGIIPLVILTLKFGQANVQSVSGIEDAETSRLSLVGWLWYARVIPDQIGWLTVILAGSYVGISTFRKQWRLPRADYAFLLLCLIFGYLFFSAVDLKDPRLNIYILFPLPIFAVLLLTRIFPTPFSTVLSVGFAIASLVYTIRYDEVPYVRGYDRVSDYIAENAPQNSAVLFSGYRDGSFIFHLRTHEERRDLSVIRADKLLLRVTIRRGLGVRERNMTEAQLADTLSRLGVHYVINQPNFWDDIENMKMLQRLLASPQFEEVASFPIVSNRSHLDKEVKVYRNRSAVLEGDRSLELHLDIIGTTIRGGINKTNRNEKSPDVNKNATKYHTAP